MVAVSVIIVTLLERDDIRPIPYFEASDFDDYELVIRRDEGIARARNRGIEEASSDKLVFIDDDARPCDSYLARIDELLDHHVAVAGKVVQPPDDPFADWHLPWYDQGTVPKETDMISGCNMAFRRALFDQIGRFDQRFAWGHEETELANRICTRHSIHYAPDWWVEHRYAGSRRHYWKKQYLIGQSDIKWWRKKGRPTGDSMGRMSPLSGNVLHLNKRDVDETVTRTIGSIARRIGRITELLS